MNAVLARGARIRVERAAERRRIAELPRAEAREAAARVLEGQGPAVLEGLPVWRLLKSVRGIGVVLAAEALEVAAIDDDGARLDALDAEQRSALADAIRGAPSHGPIGPEPEPEPEPVAPTCGACGEELVEPAPLCGFCAEAR